jgi:hypothetical protein
MNRSRMTFLNLTVVAAIAVWAATPAGAVERKAPSPETAAVIAKAIQALPGPLSGASFEVEAISQADFERLQPSAVAALWLPDQRKARFFTIQAAYPPVDGPSRVVASGEDVSVFLDRLAADFPDLTSGRWILTYPMKADMTGRQIPKLLEPTAPRTSGQPVPQAAMMVFSDTFSTTSLSPNWTVDDSTSGTLRWGVTSCNAHTGTYSVGAVAGGISSGCSQIYTNNFQTDLYRTGCDSVSGAATATLAAWVEVATADSGDVVGFMMPITYGGYSYYGPALTGNNPGSFVNYSWDLRAWPVPSGTADLTARSCTGLAVTFQTGSSGTRSIGARVDDIQIAVTSGGGVGGGGGGGGGSAGCTPNGTTLCLIGNRFAVTAQYDTYGAPTIFSNATATAFSDTTGFFTTVTAGDVDVVVKMVNFCSLNGTWSAYIGGTTDLGVKVAITDTAYPSRTPYNTTNAIGNPWGLIRQVAFTCP